MRREIGPAGDARCFSEIGFALRLHRAPGSAIRLSFRLWVVLRRAHDACRRGGFERDIMAVAPRGDNRRKAIATRCSDSAPGLADVLADRARRSRSLRYGFVRSYSAGSSSEIRRRESQPGVAISVERTVIVCGKSVREVATCDCVYGFVSHLYPLDAIDALPASSRVCGSAVLRSGGRDSSSIGVDSQARDDKADTSDRRVKCRRPPGSSMPVR